MKNNLTFLFLWLSLLMTAQPNLGVIKVNVEDGCGNSFDKPVTIDLYQKDGSIFTKIATSNTHPAQFNDLETALTYEVRMSSSDMQETDISIKDIHAMRQGILGVYPFTIPTVFVGDSNGSTGLSTFDMVLMQRYMIHIPGNNYNQWFFFDQANINATSLTGDFLNKTTIVGIPNGIKEITFNGYKHGAVASTIAKNCQECPIDTNAVAGIHLPDMDVQEGKEVEFSLNYKSSNKDIGMLFSLKYNDGVISKITPGTGVIFNLVDSISSIHMIAYSTIIGWTTNNLEIAKIKFTPLRSGKLASFFEFNNQFKNEFIFEGNDCVNAYQNVTISTTPMCPITWPADATIPDCTANYNTGIPIIDPSCGNLVSFNYTDIVFGVPCQKINRTWNVLNWITNEIFTHTQIITIDRNLSLICVETTVVVQNGITIYAIDFIKDIVNGHVYSFSPSDPTQNTIFLTYTPPYVEYLTVYDLTANTFCVAKVTKVNTACNDPINVTKVVSVNATNGTYLVSGDKFNGGNNNHCRGTISDFEFRIPQTGNYGTQSFFDYDQYKGTNLAVELRYKVNGTYENYGLVTINFLTGNELPPFELSCYDDPLTKNVPYEIAFFSPTFDNIFALQGAIRVKDAIVVSTSKIALSDIKFNEELRALRFVWFQPNVTQLTLGATDTLFTMTILPTESGNLSDVLSIADDLLQSEAVLNDFDQTRIDLVFKFLRRSSATKDLKQVDMTIYPNPMSTGDFTIQSNGYDKAQISVFNENGQMIHQSENTAVDGMFHVSLSDNTKSGMYMVRIANDRYFSMKKIILLR